MNESSGWDLTDWEKSLVRCLPKNILSLRVMSRCAQAVQSKYMLLVFILPIRFDGDMRVPCALLLGILW